MPQCSGASVFFNNSVGSFSFCAKTIRLVHPWGYSSSVDKWQILALSPRWPESASVVRRQQCHSAVAALQMQRVKENQPETSQEAKPVTVGGHPVLRSRCLFSVSYVFCTDLGSTASMYRFRKSEEKTKSTLHKHTFKDKLTRSNRPVEATSGLCNVIMSSKRTVCCCFVDIFLTRTLCFTLLL